MCLEGHPLQHEDAHHRSSNPVNSNRSLNHAVYLNPFPPTKASTFFQNFSPLASLAWKLRAAPFGRSLGCLEVWIAGLPPLHPGWGCSPHAPGSAVGGAPTHRFTPSLPPEAHFLRRIRSLRILRSLKSLRKAALTIEAIAVVCSGPYRLSHPSPPSSLKSLSSLNSLSLNATASGGIPSRHLPRPARNPAIPVLPVSFCEAASRRPSSPMRRMSRTQGRKQAQGRTCGARPPLRLRGFVPSCEPSRALRGDLVLRFLNAVGFRQTQIGQNAMWLRRPRKRVLRHNRLLPSVATSVLRHYDIS